VFGRHRVAHPAVVGETMAADVERSRVKVWPKRPGSPGGLQWGRKPPIQSAVIGGRDGRVHPATFSHAFRG